MPKQTPLCSRRQLLAAGTATVALPLATAGRLARAATATDPVVTPNLKQRILLSCKLGMIAKELEGKQLSLVERLQLAGSAGFDGVDFDEAGNFSLQDARAAVAESGLFVHNAIDHAHWSATLTSADEAVRAQGRSNIEHCIRLSHAAGGNGVLIVVGKQSDGEAEIVAERCRNEIKTLIPIAAALGQPILIENVWNQMFYGHDDPPEQGPEQFIEFVDSFNSPWVGMYYDIGNHWKYGQPGEWIRQFGHRCVKLDLKGFSRAENKFTEIGEGDLPWDQVRQGLGDIGFTGWATAEVGGGGLARLTTVRKQMEQVLFGDA